MTKCSVILPQAHPRALVHHLWHCLQALHSHFRALAAFLTRFAHVREERLRNPPRQAQPQLQWHGARGLQQQDPGESPAKRRRIASARHEELNRWAVQDPALHSSIESGARGIADLCCLGTRQQSCSPFVAEQSVQRHVSRPLCSTCFSFCNICFGPCLLAHQHCVKVPSDMEKTPVHEILSAQDWLLCCALSADTACSQTADSDTCACQDRCDARLTSHLTPLRLQLESRTGPTTCDVPCLGHCRH